MQPQQLQQQPCSFHMQDKVRTQTGTAGGPPPAGGHPHRSLPWQRQHAYMTPVHACMVDRRYVKDGSMKTEYPVIIGGDNFGCGSSREHAPVALGASGGCAFAEP